MDELPEFDRDTLEALREFLERLRRLGKQIDQRDDIC